MRAQLDVIGIVVEDMGRSLDFYRQLGFDLPSDADGQPHVEAELRGGIRVAWDTVETIHSFDPEWQPPNGGHRIALSFGVDTPGEVDAAYEQLTAAGYVGYKAPWDAFWGMRYAIVNDPDGNAVDLFCPNT